MNMLRSFVATIAPVVLCVGAGSGDKEPAQRPQTPPIEQKYAASPLGSFGVTSLADLRGRPVVICCWGKTCPDCLERVLPLCLKLKDRFGDNFHLVFVECQSATLDEYEAVAWRLNAMWNGPMWTTERPDLEYKSVPTAIVLGIDGRVLLMEGGSEIGSALEKIVEQEVKLVKLPPPGTPKQLEGAWQAFLRDDVAAAFAQCEKLSTPEARAAKAEFTRRIEARISRMSWKIQNGFLSSVEKDFDGLSKAVKGCAELARKTASAYVQLASTVVGSIQEPDADKDFVSFLAKLKRDSPFDPATVKKAATLAAKYKDTKSGARFERYVQASRVDPAKFTK